MCGEIMSSLLEGRNDYAPHDAHTRQQHEHSSGAVQKSLRNAGTFLSINSSCKPILQVTRHLQLFPTNFPSHQPKWHLATLRLPPTLTLTASTPLPPETSLSPPLATSLESSSATTLLLNSTPRPSLLAPLLLSSMYFSIDHMLYFLLTFFPAPSSPTTSLRLPQFRAVPLPLTLSAVPLPSRSTPVLVTPAKVRPLLSSTMTASRTERTLVLALTACSLVPRVKLSTLAFPSTPVSATLRATRPWAAPAATSPTLRTESPTLLKRLAFFALNLLQRSTIPMPPTQTRILL